MTYEDFTTYTEGGSDADSILTQTSVRASFTDLNRKHDVYLYKDKGIDHFDDFDHKIDVYLDSGEIYSFAGVWALSNEINNLLSHAGDNVYVAFRCTATTGDYYLRLQSYYNGSPDQTDEYSCSLDTSYYLRIKRSGSATITCAIYSSASDRDNEQNALATLSITPTFGQTKFRYIYGSMSLGATTGVDRYCTGYSENLDLQEGVATYTKTFQTDILFKKLGIAKTLGLDVDLQKKDLTKQFATDIFFKKVGTKTFGADAFLKKSNLTLSFAIDSIFGVVSKAKTFDLDLLLKALGLKKTFLINAVLRKTRSVTVGLDVALCKTRAKTFSTNVLFRRLEVTSFLIDAYFGVVGAVAYTRSFALDVVFAYKVKLPEILLDESGKIVLNVSRPYVWVGD